VQTEEQKKYVERRYTSKADSKTGIVTYIVTFTIENQTPVSITFTIDGFETANQTIKRKAIEKAAADKKITDDITMFAGKTYTVKPGTTQLEEDKTIILSELTKLPGFTGTIPSKKAGVDRRYFISKIDADGTTTIIVTSSCQLGSPQTVEFKITGFATTTQQNTISSVDVGSYSSELGIVGVATQTTNFFIEHNKTHNTNYDIYYGSDYGNKTLIAA
jgi:hypothetical protein